MESDPDLARPVVGLVAGLLVISKASSVACDERSAEPDPLANGLEVAGPAPLSRQGPRRCAAARHRVGLPRLRYPVVASRCRRCLLDLAARGCGEAEERAGPSGDRVLVCDTFADEVRQWVAVAD